VKELKIWNGRWYPRSHIYAAAYSRADLVRLIATWQGYQSRGMATEIKNYWSEGSWGTAMNGITPERGIWLSKDGAAPVRAFPK